MFRHAAWAHQSARCSSWRVEVMAGLTWILTLICAAGGQLSSASPVPGSVLVVLPGQTVSLDCNLTSSQEVTWFLLRSDRLLPLVTVKSSRIVGGDTATFHVSNHSRLDWGGELEGGVVTLTVREAEPADGGLYFCTGRCVAGVCVNAGVQLRVDGRSDQSTSDRTPPPCWSLGICLLPASLSFFLVGVAGIFLCSGKSCDCCCRLKVTEVTEVTEEDSLHYSSLKHPDKPRPSSRGGTRLVDEKVVYSAVASHKNPKWSHDLR